MNHHFPKILPRPWIIAALFVAVGLALPLGARAYDPLSKNSAPAPGPLELSIHDAQRNRDLPLRVYLPVERTPEPVILFSPGLGGSREMYSYLGQQWAAHGYVVVVMQHPGSDDSVWKDKAPAEAMLAMKQAASVQEFLLRVKDVPAVLDQLAVWNRKPRSPLNGRLDLEKIGMSGHSFGAITTQAVSGESYAMIGPRYTDPRIKAAVALSPGVPQRGSAAKAFSSVKIPWMLMTGTKDNAPIGNQDAASRLGVYPNLHGIPKYEVVLDKAEHSAFTERPLPGAQEPRNPNHHRVILALSSAFWDAYLRGDDDALKWLQGGGPRSVMEPADTWKFDQGN
jgi:predicted dienelactone hydrolase